MASRPHQNWLATTSLKFFAQPNFAAASHFSCSSLLAEAMGDLICRLLLVLLFLLLLSMAAAADNSSRVSSSSSSAVSYLRGKPRHLSSLLKRQKRWLIFELGTSVTLTANCAKAIVGTIPRGLVLLAEATSIYEMPGAVEDWFPRRKRKPTPKPPPPIPPPPPPPAPDMPGAVPVVPVAAAPISWPHQPLIIPLSPADPVHSFYYTYPQLSPELGDRKSFVQQPSVGCPAAQLVKDAYTNYYCQPPTATQRLGRELKRNGAKLVNEGRSPHGMLFDLLIMLSEIHQYRSRYCIMRTLCESRHLLAPPGQLLFHDIFRILLRYVYPEIAHKPPYLKAFTSGYSLHQCAHWYGAHCPQSFLLHLSDLFRGKMPNVFNKMS